MRYPDFEKYIDQKYAHCNNGLSGVYAQKGWRYTFCDAFEWMETCKPAVYKELRSAIRKAKNGPEAEESVCSLLQDASPYFYYGVKHRTGTPKFYVFREFMEKYGKFFRPDSDMAMVMVFSKDQKNRIFLSGNGRDGLQRVSLINEGVDIPLLPISQAMFELGEGGYISDYDCAMIPAMELAPGRYYAYNVEGLVMLRKA